VAGACCGLWYLRAQAQETAAAPPSAQAQETKAEEKKPLSAQELTEKLAALEADTKAKYVDMDTIWTLVAAFLVFWMQAGFALVETGLTRAKNSVHICMKNLLDFCFASIVFWAFGFGIMFGKGGGWMGTSGFFLNSPEAGSPERPPRSCRARWRSGRSSPRT
jgi:hypothetical protein